MASAAPDQDDPLDRLAFIPAEWTIVRRIVQLLVVVALVSGAEYALFRLGDVSSHPVLGGIVFFGSGIAVFLAGWSIRRTVSKIGGSALMLAGGIHVIVWSLGLVYLLIVI